MKDYALLPLLAMRHLGPELQKPEFRSLNQDQIIDIFDNTQRQSRCPQLLPLDIEVTAATEPCPPYFLSFTSDEEESSDGTFQLLVTADKPGHYRVVDEGRATRPRGLPDKPWTMQGWGELGGIMYTCQCPKPRGHI